MRAAEEAAFARGIEVEALMDQAGAGVARAVRQFFPRPGSCIVYAGKGHNGGDALVAADCLQRAGWQIDVRLPFPEDQYSELTRKKLAALRDCKSGRGLGAPTIAPLPPLIILAPSEILEIFAAPREQQEEIQEKEIGGLIGFADRQLGGDARGRGSGLCARH